MSEINPLVKKSLDGIYVLIIQVGEDIDINVGALGTKSFTKGLYAYIGSAQINMEQRIKRHLRKQKQKFWHIDYLLENATVEITKVFFKKANKTEECKIARTISEKRKSISDFGCSDCNCKSHLFKIDNYSFLQETMQVFPIEK